MNYANNFSHLITKQKQITKQNRKIITFTKRYSLASPQLKPNGQRQPSDLTRIQCFTDSRKMFIDDFINQTQKRKKSHTFQAEPYDRKQYKKKQDCNTK